MKLATWPRERRSKADTRHPRDAEEFLLRSGQIRWEMAGHGIFWQSPDGALCRVNGESQYVNSVEVLICPVPAADSGEETTIDWPPAEGPWSKQSS